MTEAAHGGLKPSPTGRLRRVFVHLSYSSSASPIDGALTAHGLQNKEIARHLYPGNATVKNHVHSILQKLKIQRRSEIFGRLPLRYRSLAGGRHPYAFGTLPKICLRRPPLILPVCGQRAGCATVAFLRSAPTKDPDLERTQSRPQRSIDGFVDRTIAGRWQTAQ